MKVGQLVEKGMTVFQPALALLALLLVWKRESKMVMLCFGELPA